MSPMWDARPMGRPPDARSPRRREKLHRGSTDRPRICRFESRTNSRGVAIGSLSALAERPRAFHSTREGQWVARTDNSKHDDNGQVVDDNGEAVDDIDDDDDDDDDRTIEVVVVEVGLAVWV